MALASMTSHRRSILAQHQKIFVTSCLRLGCGRQLPIQYALVRRPINFDMFDTPRIADCFVAHSARVGASRHVRNLWVGVLVGTCPVFCVNGASSTTDGVAPASRARASARLSAT